MTISTFFSLCYNLPRPHPYRVLAPPTFTAWLPIFSFLFHTISTLTRPPFQRVCCLLSFGLLVVRRNPRFDYLHALLTCSLFSCQSFFFVSLLGQQTEMFPFVDLTLRLHLFPFVPSPLYIYFSVFFVAFPPFCFRVEHTYCQPYPPPSLSSPPHRHVLTSLINLVTIPRPIHIHPHPPS